MTPTRPQTLLVVAAVCAGGAWLLAWAAYLALPPLPWTGVPALLLLAIAEGWSGWSLRSRLRGRTAGGRPVQPLAVARMAVLAKATSLVGAIFAGLAAGFLIYVSGSLGKSAFRADAFASGATFGAAVVLVAAALYLEYGCRIPPSGRKKDEEDHRGGPVPPG